MQRPVVLYRADNREAGKPFGERELDVRRRAPALSLGVETRLEGLDQAKLADRCLQFVAALDPFDRLGVGQELGYLLAAVAAEVRTDPGAQVRRLAHVEDPPGAV